MDNPSAFPLAIQGAFSSKSNYGMSLRDWFAGQALSAIIRQCAADTDARKDGPEVHFARKAYAVADAMLAERAKATDQ